MRKRIYADKAQPKAKKSKSVVRKKVSSYRYPATTGFARIAPRSGSGTEIFSQFIYSEKFTINPPTGGLAGVYVFNLTSLFDPNTTGIGHQPANFDQYAVMFEKYLVYEAEIKVSLANGTTSQLLFGMSISDFPTTNPDPSVYLENGQTQWKMVSEGGANPIAEQTMHVDIAAANGVTKKQLFADDVYRADFSSSPIENIYCHIWLADVSNGDPGSVGLVTEIRYKAKLMGTKLNALS